jgi:hypothetical protein
MRLLRPLACLSACLLTLAVLTLAVPAPAAAQRTAAPALLDSAIARMGGAERLRAVARVRLEMLTQWQRLQLDERPYGDQPSYELHSELRDYEVPAWRNTRRFLSPRASAGTGPAAPAEITDVVRDSVAIRRAPSAPPAPAPAAGGAPAAPAPSWGPLNVAYVDERRELFATAPERALLAVRDARDLRAMPDTTIAGRAHARFTATVDRYPATLFVRRGDGLPAMLRLRAAQPNDFGLAPWGEMEVELWYSAWTKQQDGITYPMQWDVRRVGRPYKRMTVLGVTFNPEVAADSFAVSDSLRGAFLATANRAMHDLALDAAQRVDDDWAAFNTAGAPAGAVRIGGEWLLLEAGQAPMNAERAVAWLARTDSGAPVVGALVTPPASGSGGSAWLARGKLPIYVGPGAAPFQATLLRNHGAPVRTLVPVERGRWLRVGTDSLWLTPFDLPDAPGALVAYWPAREWLYSATAQVPAHRDLLLAHARARRWKVARLGSARGVSVPLPPPPAAPAATTKRSSKSPSQ